MIRTSLWRLLVVKKNHTLTKAEIPPHTHDYVDYHRGGGAGNEVGIWHNRYDITTNRTTADGYADGLRGEAHNNLPPYSSLHMEKELLSNSKMSFVLAGRGTTLNEIYPVGSVIIKNAPWNGFPGQTWKLFSQGKTLVGLIQTTLNLPL